MKQQTEPSLPDKQVARPLEPRAPGMNSNQSDRELEKEIGLLAPAADLIAFATLLGFKEVPKDDAGLLVGGSNLKNCCILQSSTGVLVALYKDIDERYQFVQLGNASISGDIRQFFIQYQSPFPNDFLAALQREQLASRHPQSSSRKNELKHHTASISRGGIKGYEELYKNAFGLRELNQRTWFYNALIKDATLDHTFFRSRFCSREFRLGDGNTEIKPVFPLYTGTSLSGFAYPAKTGGFQISGEGVWISNIINEQKLRRLIIVSDPLEALAYHQMFSKPSDLLSVYLACCSEDYKQNSIWTQVFIDKFRPEQVIIATNQDERGQILATALLGQLSEPRLPVKNKLTFKEENSEIRFEISALPERNNEYILLSVYLSFFDFDKGVFMNDNLVKYFEQINLREKSEHSEFGNIAPFDVTIRIVSKHTSIADIVFPLGKGLMPTAERIVRHLRPILFLKAEKPALVDGSISFSEDLRLQSVRLSSKENRPKRTG